MELVSLKVENFGSIGNITLPLNKPGLILVTGINKDAPNADSNGSGKSLIFEAICWCLWGETVRGLSADEVVNTQAGKDCAVALTLTEHDVTYTISRHRLDSRTKKPNDLVVTRNGSTLGASGMKTMQEVVDQIIGFDFTTFRAMMPGAGVKVANMTDKAIKELLESLLQTEQLSQAHDESKAKLKTLESVISQHTNAITQSRQQLFSCAADISNLKNMRAQMEASRLRTREGHESRIAALKAEILDFDKQISEEKSLTAEHFDYRTKANKLEQDIYLEYIEPLKTALALKDEKIQEQNGEAAFLQRQRDTAQANLNKAKNLGAKCTSCFQSVSAEHSSAIYKELEASIEELTNKAKIIPARIALLKEEKRNLERDTMSVVTEKRQRVEQLRFAEAAIKSKLDGLETAKKLRTRASSDLERVRGELQSLESEEFDFEAMIATKEKLASKLEATILEHQKAVEEAEHEARICSFWVSGFSPSGLRSFMLDYVTPILNDRAKYYAELLTNGELTVSFSTKSTLKSGQEKDKFAICCQQTHGADSYKGSSAGERARADLVIAMALGDLAQFRTAKQLPWRFLDEPFESIDRSGTEAIVRLLNDQKTRYRTVFVVTHKPDFKELFSQQLTIVKENGISTLST
jgi:DNA repair exonuclease SbcCD ATPase subunit